MMNQGSKITENKLLNFVRCPVLELQMANYAKTKVQGQFTCFQPNGNSIVDYLFIRENDFDKYWILKLVTLSILIMVI